MARGAGGEPDLFGRIDSQRSRDSAQVVFRISTTSWSPVGDGIRLSRCSSLENGQGSRARRPAVATRRTALASMNARMAGK